LGLRDWFDESSSIVSDDLLTITCSLAAVKRSHCQAVRRAWFRQHFVQLLPQIVGAFLSRMRNSGIRPTLAGRLGQGLIVSAVLITNKVIRGFLAPTWRMMLSHGEDE
jgi:hypothetical protein